MKENALAGISPQVHDLVQMDANSLGCTDAPDWVRQSLTRCPWAVVRRARAPKGMISIGVRGSVRSERWGGWVETKVIRRIVEPRELLLVSRSRMEVTLTPALQALEKVMEQWQGLRLPWGPTGGVGFELASGHPVTTPISDLDIAIRASMRMSVEWARLLWEQVKDLRPKVDVRVETPECGFSLEEFVRPVPARILLQYPECVALGDDPWCDRSPTLGALE